MATTLKTQASDIDIETYLDTNVPAERQSEAHELVRMFEHETGFRAVIWGGMVGFGRYEYTYDSGHSGAFFATGFAVRKAEISIHILAGYDGLEPHLAMLGKHRVGKSCLSIRCLDAVNHDALRAIIRDGLVNLAKRWPITAA